MSSEERTFPRRTQGRCVLDGVRGQRVEPGSQPDDPREDRPEEVPQHHCGHQTRAVQGHQAVLDRHHGPLRVHVVRRGAGARTQRHDLDAGRPRPDGHVHALCTLVRRGGDGARRCLRRRRLACGDDRRIDRKRHRAVRRTIARTTGIRPAAAGAAVRESGRDRPVDVVLRAGPVAPVPARRVRHGTDPAPWLARLDVPDTEPLALEGSQVPYLGVLLARGRLGPLWQEATWLTEVKSAAALEAPPG